MFEHSSTIHYPVAARALRAVRDTPRHTPLVNVHLAGDDILRELRLVLSCLSFRFSEACRLVTVQLRKSNLRHERLDPKKDDGLRRYIVACAVAALAAGIRVTLALTIEPRPPMLVMSTGAVGVAAWFGGFGPGLLATGLCSLLGLFFVDPQFSVDFEQASDLIDVGIFVFVGIGVSWLCESLRVARDRADRAMKQAELLSAREHERLMEADRRKDEFIALLAHELRNPLAPLRNVAAILRCKSHSSPEYFRCLDLLERQVRQMARLLDDLLDISRVTRGRLQLQRQPTGLTKVLRDVIEGAESSSVAKGLTVEISCPPEEIILDADPVRLTAAGSRVDPKRPELLRSV